ncbi:hypothetical protein [Entomomonas asaccharolytica]|nr:hypothetical protein [Entomomonas asaccharolytica]
MPKITIVLVAFIAALIWVFIIKGDGKTATNLTDTTTEQVAK